MEVEKKRRAPPPPRPQITLQIPDSSAPRAPPSGNVYWGPNMFQGLPPGTPAHVAATYFNPFQYHGNKAGDFVFKQFEGFKDFTMNTAKSGMSVGEKTAFWVISKLRVWSKRWFTHFFLSLCLLLYSAMGAAIFMALEDDYPDYSNPYLYMWFICQTISSLYTYTWDVKMDWGLFNHQYRPHEDKYNKTLLGIRRDFSTKIYKITFDHVHEKVQNQTAILDLITASIRDYEPTYQECMKHLGSEDKTWSFWNSLVYAGTIYTTIGE